MEGREGRQRGGRGEGGRGHGDRPIPGGSRVEVVPHCGAGDPHGGSARCTAAATEDKDQRSEPAPPLLCSSSPGHCRGWAWPGSSSCQPSAQPTPVLQHQVSVDRCHGHLPPEKGWESVLRCPTPARPGPGPHSRVCVGDRDPGPELSAQMEGKVRPGLVPHKSCTGGGKATWLRTSQPLRGPRPSPLSPCGIPGASPSPQSLTTCNGHLVALNKDESASKLTWASRQRPRGELLPNVPSPPHPGFECEATASPLAGYGR